MSVENEKSTRKILEISTKIQRLHLFNIERTKKKGIKLHVYVWFVEMAFIICSLDCELKLIKLLQLSLGFTEKYN